MLTMVYIGHRQLVILKKLSPRSAISRFKPTVGYPRLASGVEYDCKGLDWQWLYAAYKCLWFQRHRVVIHDIEKSNAKTWIVILGTDIGSALYWLSCR
jgi:hypothetical protein